MSDHYYRVFVQGYVFPMLPTGSSDDEVRKQAATMAEEGSLDVTGTWIEGEWDE